MRCLVCGGGRHDLLLDARRMDAELRWLRRFHERRLKPGPDGTVTEEALADRASFTQDEAVDLLVCRGCGLVFRHPRPSGEEARRRYALDCYGPDRLEALIAGARDFHEARADELAGRLAGFPGAGAPRVVEIGSFVGGFLDAGRARGWSIVGVDPGHEVGDFCRARGHTVIERLGDVPFAPGTVDAVVIWNTFDQLPDPAPVLEGARRLLRPGGTLVVRVPNGAFVRSLVAIERRLGRRAAALAHLVLAWNNLVAFPYLFGYSPAILARLVGRFGFRAAGVHSDTLVPLAGEETRRWAAIEERVVKRLLLVLAALRARWPAPWSDVWFHRV